MVAISSPHFVIFPFMAKGHTIPLLYLARLLWQRHVSVTIFTTPANSLSIRATLHDTSISIIELTFPESIDGIPSGVESTDKLPSMSLFIDFATATKLMQPQFEQALEGLQPVSCIVSDHFMGWTQDSAAKLGIPRIGFSGMSCFGMTMYETLGRQKPHALTSSLDEPFSIPNFPKLTLTRSDFDPPFDQLEPKGPWVNFIIEQTIALANSYGLIVNSFYELESSYMDYWNRCIGPKSWCLGPFCIAKAKTVEDESTKPKWKQWLDDKAMIGESVLYVAFGTQAEVSEEQILEIAKGLEQSYVNFLWVIRPKAMEILKGFEERVKDRGLMVKEWVDQMEILQHKSVKGFLSHCGWNSVTEAICAGVPILAMPFMAEQYLNARLVAEEISVGLRIRPSNGSVRGFVKSEEVEERVREMIEGRKGEEIRKKTKKVGEAAVNAMREGGSSWKTLDQLIIDVSNYEAIS
ncbi:UDP-glycosyltransferase 90A1-like [Coffea arabica]|uniref:Glycosyltransferase n=1 Tax=Coffea arabica TaxID=13443 RepID=A0A6P6UTW5_COFAR|nr:UDP-glycosyltransferase 90A1-like [Coffea arabica]XP_027093756.1 UDP-glycosyltransferase 90A1-like [Coffea arabica]